MQTHALLLTLATLTAALAGCTGDDSGQGTDATSPPDDPGNPLEDGNGTGLAPVKVTSWDGSITASVGAPTPLGHISGGVFSLPGSFKVGDGATGLLVELVWPPAAGAVPIDLHLSIWDPSGTQHENTEGQPGSPDSPASLFFDDPATGTWEAMGWTNGATAMQDYTIHASVFYDGDMPDGYTAVG